MDMTGERRIPAPRQRVWEALNDTETLRQSIPGCEKLEMTGENEMRATASVKIGPISARFTGEVTLSEIDPPNGYRISGKGQGGAAGFANGGANVSLTEDGDVTVLSYVVKAQVGGKLAQLGARLVDATAKQMADAFFDRFTAAVTAPAPEPEPVAMASAPMTGAPESPRPATPPPAAAPLEVKIAPLGIPLLGWAAIGVAVIAVILWAALK